MNKFSDEVERLKYIQDPFGKKDGGIVKDTKHEIMRERMKW